MCKFQKILRSFVCHLKRKLRSKVENVANPDHLFYEQCITENIAKIHTQNIEVVFLNEITLSTTPQYLPITYIYIRSKKHSTFVKKYVYLLF